MIKMLYSPYARENLLDHILRNSGSVYLCCLVLPLA